MGAKTDDGNAKGWDQMGKYSRRTRAGQFLYILALSMSFAIASTGSTSPQSSGQADSKTASAKADTKTLVMTDPKCELAVPPDARFVVVTTDTNELQIYGAVESRAQFCAEMINLPSQDVGLFANLRPLK